jgi:PilZ domain
MAERERRSKRRYPLELNLRYRSVSNRMGIAGTGRTVNVSSAGLLVAASHDLLEGIRLQVMVEWPWLLDQSTPLQLVAESRVVRTGNTEFAVELLRYQFRTTGKQALPVDPLVWAMA